MTLTEAASKGIIRVRLDVWANKTDYIKIHLIDGMMGPWLELFSPTNKAIGQKNPQKLFAFDRVTMEANGFKEYKDLIDEDDK